MNRYYLLTLCALIFISLPYWLPSYIIRLRMMIFTRINGQKSIQLPDERFNSEDFKNLYAHPAITGRSKGAALSDLFWYWLSPGPEMHPEHIENGEKYEKISRFTRQLLSHSRVDIHRIIDVYEKDGFQLGLSKHSHSPMHIRLCDKFMPIWASFFYELVFEERCSENVKRLIVNNANDVVTALKCCKLRNMARRDQLTQFLSDKLLKDEFPHEFPDGFTHIEKVYYLQGAFFNTAIVQMSEAMTHLILAIAQHASCQQQIKKLLNDDKLNEYLGHVINESLRLYPLFGIAHRVAKENIKHPVANIEKDMVVCFNYPSYHQIGYTEAEQFDPDRWQKCPYKNANFIPFGVSSNRSCPAQGIALVAMRRLTKHLLSEYYFASSVQHTRSLPSRGPCLVATNPEAMQRVSVTGLMLPLIKIRDRWEDLYRSIVQLVLGTVMIIHARQLRLCETYFRQHENPEHI